MVFGMSLATYTVIHVIVSFAGILSGLIVMFGMFASKRMSGWTVLFLITTVLTSVTGLGFPFTHVTLPQNSAGFRGKHYAGSFPRR